MKGLIRFLGKTLKLAIFIVAVIVTVVALAYAGLSFAGRRELDRTKRELIASGEKLSLMQLAPPPIPDGLNFFAAPIWQGYRDWTDAHGPAKANPFASFAEDKEGRRWYRPMVFTSPFESGKLSDLDGAARFLHASKDPAPSGESAAGEILRVIAERAPILSAIEEAAKRPAARWPVAYDKDFRIGLPHLSPVQNIVVVLRLRTTARMASGDSAGAVRDLRLMLRMANYLEPEPGLISHLVRQSIFAITVPAFWECTARGTWTEPDLLTLQRQFARPNLPSDLVRSLGAERGTLNDWISHAQSRRDLWTNGVMFSMTDQKTRPKFSPAVVGFFYPHGLLLMDVAAYNRRIQSTIDLISSGDFDALRRLQADTPSAFRWSHPITSLAFPAIISPATRFFDIQNTLRLAETACALERHRLATGDFPASLDALVPAFLDAVPVNAASRQPINYERLGSANYRLSTPAIGTSSSIKRMTRDGKFVWEREPVAGAK